MSSNYVPSDQDGHPGLNALVGLALTLLVFAILPFMHYLGKFSKPPSLIDTAETADQPPPPPPEDQPPPPEEEEELEEPEMEEPPPPMTLAQLEMALEPGSGNATGDFGFGNFGDSIDALDDMQIFDLADVDKAPFALVQSDPVYPYSMQQAKVRGSATVRFVIDATGKVRRARVIKSTHREFEQPAIDAVNRSTFSPAEKGGQAVACNAQLVVQFTP